MRSILVVVGFVVSVGTARADDCEKYVERSRPVLGIKAGKAGDSTAQMVVESCRRGLARTSENAILISSMKCVLAAKDDAAVKTCWDKTTPTEAKRFLTKLFKNASVTYMTTAEFPKGKVGPTPPGKPCCKRANKRCEASPEWASAPLWTELEFLIDQPTQFQYSYTSDGKTASATAVGDLECDGKPEKYVLQITVKKGEPQMKLTEPLAKKPAKK